MVVAKPTKKKRGCGTWTLIAIVGLIGLSVLGNLDLDSGTSPSRNNSPATTTTTTLSRFRAFTLTGSGDDVVDLRVPGDAPAVLGISHAGSSNFSVVTYSASGSYLDLLVNEIGSYSGSRPVNLIVGESVGELEITAGGSWRIEVTSVVDAKSFRSQASGSGDTVLLYSGSASRLVATHTGESNFVVRAYGPGGRDLLVNEIGPYSGTVRLDSGTVLIEIEADGAWTVDA